MKSRLLLSIIGLIILPIQVQAAVLQSEDTRGYDYFNNKNYAKAAVHFSDPAWKGVSWYKAGDYAKAIDVLKNLSDTVSMYNLGNAYAKTKQYQEAINMYDKVLEVEPNHEDAFYNKELIQNLLNKQQNSDSSSEQQGENNEQDNQANSSKEQESKAGSNHDDTGKKSDADKNSNEGPKQNDAGDKDHQSQKNQPNKTEAESSPKNEKQSDVEKEQNEKLKGKSEPKKEAGPTNMDSQKLSKEQGKTQNDELKKMSIEQLPNNKLSGKEEILLRIQDDPAALLKRKFAQQSEAMPYDDSEDDYQW